MRRRAKLGQDACIGLGLPLFCSSRVAVLDDELWASWVPLAFHDLDHVSLEVAFEDMHEVGQEVPYHVPHGQKGKRAHEAYVRPKPGVAPVIKTSFEGLGVLSVFAHSLVRSQRNLPVALGSPPTACPPKRVVQGQERTKLTVLCLVQGIIVRKELLAPVATVPPSP